MFLCDQQERAMSSKAESSNVDSEEFKVSFEGEVFQTVHRNILID